MKICDHLLGKINFEPDYCAQPCCDIRATGVPSFALSGTKISMSEYKTHFDTSLMQLQKQSGLCAGCHELYTADVSLPDLLRKPLIFQNVSINHHRYFCNCRCVYCELWKRKSPNKPYNVLPYLQSLHTQNALATSCAFSWGGGEPTILKEFDKAAHWIYEQGYLQYIHTNALIRSKAIEALLPGGKTWINVSLDAGTAKTYCEIKGVDKFNTVISTLEHYSTIGAGRNILDLKYIIFEANNTLPEIEAFLQICKRLKIPQVQYSFNFAEVNRKAVSQNSLLAAIFLTGRAKALEIACQPFFISPEYLAKIKACEPHFIEKFGGKF